MVPGFAGLGDAAAAGGAGDVRADACGDGVALSGDVEGVPAAAGYRGDRGGERGGAIGELHAHGAVAGPGSASGAAGPGCGQRGGVRGRGQRECDRQCGADDDRAAAARRAEGDGAADRRAAAGGAVSDPGPGDLHAAGAGHPDRHAGEPDAVPVHAGGYGDGDAGGVGATAAGAAAGGAGAAGGEFRPAGRGVPRAGAGGPRCRDAAGCFDAGGAGHAVQRVRAAADLDDFCAIEPVSRGAGGRPLLAG